MGKNHKISSKDLKGSYLCPYNIHWQLPPWVVLFRKPLPWLTNTSH